MSINQPVTPDNTLETLRLQTGSELYNWCTGYCDQYQTQLHRYPEEEYSQVLHALSETGGLPLEGLIIGKSTPELLEFLVEILVTQGDTMAVHADHPYREALSRQVLLRNGHCLVFQTLEELSDQSLKCILPQAPLPSDAFPGVAEVLLNPVQLYPGKRTLHLFEWTTPPATLNPLPVVFGYCGDTAFTEAIRKIQEPFHIPTQLLIRMHDTAATFCQSLALKAVSATGDPVRGVLPYIQGIQPYVPGKGIKVMARELNMPTSAFSKLASNEHPYGVTQSVTLSVKAMLKQWEAIPPTYDEVALALKEELLKSVGNPPLQPEQVLLGTGSVELIKAVIKAFVPPVSEPGAPKPVLFPQMPFAMYPFEARKRLADFETVPLEADYKLSLPKFIDAIQEKQPRVIFLANPRNPLGTALTDLNPLFEALSEEQVLVLDEAYFDFIRAEMGPAVYPDGIEILQAYPRKKIIAMRTFSKGHALASFRLGFGFARPDVAQALTDVMLPCPLDPLSMAFATASLRDAGFETEISKVVALVIQEKKRFYQLFESLGIRYVPSFGNFVYFETGNRHTGKSLFDTLVQQGVIIRPVLERSARVNVGAPHENDHFIRAMKDAYASP